MHATGALTDWALPENVLDVRRTSKSVSTCHAHTDPLAQIQTFSGSQPRTKNSVHSVS